VILALLIAVGPGAVLAQAASSRRASSGRVAEPPLGADSARLVNAWVGELAAVRSWRADVFSLARTARDSLLLYDALPPTDDLPFVLNPMVFSGDTLFRWASFTKPAWWVDEGQSLRLWMVQVSIVADTAKPLFFASLLRLPCASQRPVMRVGLGYRAENDTLEVWGERASRSVAITWAEQSALCALKGVVSVAKDYGGFLFNSRRTGDSTAFTTSPWRALQANQDVARGPVVRRAQGIVRGWVQYENRDSNTVKALLDVKCGENAYRFVDGSVYAGTETTRLRAESDWRLVPPEDAYEVVLDAVCGRAKLATWRPPAVDPPPVLSFRDAVRAVRGAAPLGVWADTRSGKMVAP